MCNKALCWECIRDGQLESSLGLAVRSTEMPFDPQIVVMDVVCIQFCQRSLWNTAEEYDDTAFSCHENTLSLSGVGWVSGDNLVSALAIGEFADSFNRIYFRAVDTSSAPNFFTMARRVSLMSIMITF